MEGKLTYLDLEALFVGASLDGQKALAFHLALGRDVLLEEQFGSIFRANLARIERLVQEEVERKGRESGTWFADSTPRVD